MSEQAPLADRLAARPPREQARVVTAIARTLRDGLAAQGVATDEADAALSAMTRWTETQSVSGPEFSELVYSEQETGVLRRLSDAQDGPSEPLWNALVTAVMYVAWLAYGEGSDSMPEDVAEVDDSTLNLLDDQWRKTSAFDPEVVQ